MKSDEHASTKTKKTLAEPEMKSTDAQTAQRPRINLDSRYGEIGISAVAAAVRYQGETKAPADAPGVAQPEERWLAEIAA
jgi:hypothetical protein